jgi:hypothetical protein
MEGQAINEAAVNAHVCGDHDGLNGEALDRAVDLVGCGLFNVDELIMRRAIAPGESYTACAWWDGADVVVGGCLDFPADR